MCYFENMYMATILGEKSLLLLNGNKKCGNSTKIRFSNSCINENTDQGRQLENEDRHSCHSCMRHSALAHCIILQTIIKTGHMVNKIQ